MSSISLMIQSVITSGLGLRTILLIAGTGWRLARENRGYERVERRRDAHAFVAEATLYGPPVASPLAMPFPCKISSEPWSPMSEDVLVTLAQSHGHKRHWCPDTTRWSHCLSALLGARPASRSGRSNRSGGQRRELLLGHRGNEIPAGPIRFRC